MKRTFKKIMLASTVIAFLVSCSKTETNPASNPGSSTDPSSGRSFIELRGAADKWQAASNRLNPVDSIGLQHNLSLSYILQKTTYEKLNNADSVYAQSFAYGNQRFGAAANAFKPLFTVTQLSAFYRGAEAAVPTTSSLLDMTGLTGVSRDYLGRIITYLYNQNTAGLPVETIKQQIVSWEAGIASLNITSRERIALYAFGSTARYSLYAWVDAVYPGNPGGHITLQRLGLFGWIATVTCDAVGGTLGAIAGGPVGGVIAGAAFSGGVALISRYNVW